jgi:hypothetical protein
VVSNLLNLGLQGGQVITVNSSGATSNTLDDGSGNMSISGTFTSTVPGSGSTQPWNLFQPALSTTNSNYLIFGKSNTVNGSAVLQFNYSSASTSASSFNLGVNGAVNALKVNGTGAAFTMNSTLDDGSGNSSFGGLLNAQYANFSGNSNGTFPTFSSSNNLAMGYVAANSTGPSQVSGGLIQCNQAGSTTAFPLLLQASAVNVLTSAGAVRTTLDDGSGNMTIRSTTTGTRDVASFYSPSMTAGANNTNIRFGVSSTTNNSANIGFQYNGNGSGTNFLLQQCGAGLVYLSAAGKFATSNSTLDDGTGRMTVLATQTSGTTTASFFQPSITAGSNATQILIGATGGGNYNAGAIGFTYTAAGATGNTLSLALNGSSAGLTLNGVNKLSSAFNTLDSGSGGLTVVTAKVGTQALTTGIYMGTATSFTTGNSNFPLSLVYSGAGSSWSTPTSGNVVSIPNGAWHVSMVFIFTLTSPYYITFNLGNSGLGTSNLPTSFQIPVSSSGYPFNFQFFIQATGGSATMTFTCGAGGSYTLSYSQITFTPAP